MRLATAEPSARAGRKPVLITGGAGFVGSNLADRLLRKGRRVRIVDSLARPGSEANLRWLLAQHRSRLQVDVADVRDGARLRAALADVGTVFHLAAQVAVTTSLENPEDDFTINARGTLDLLEALRERGHETRLIFTSTNKVYGAIDDIELAGSERRYRPKSELARSGIAETRPLQFHSPYGCSKGTADQYVLDYARSYGLATAVFRMSCIYGPHQHGTEDQGWLAHFMIRAADGEPITIYGDGKQVRDVLFVDDLVDAFLIAEQHLPDIAGEAFNIGGGPENTLSLLELIDRIAALNGGRPSLDFGNWRVGDQRWYVSDIRKFHRLTGWSPRVGVMEGVRRLHSWLMASRGEVIPMRVAAQ
ncbi:MAG: NAD-dependent epimerase/dehydratase family protein [Alphaproteobacteria bacterium]|nr:NAD-dependent epimerase/dehydratase family protein [Alphaproteobacteria bacterium]